MSAFCSIAPQRRLTTILKAVIDGCFVYEHSGENCSARTYAELHHVLSLVEINVQANCFFSPYVFLSTIRTILGSKSVKVLVTLIATVISGWAIYGYYQREDTSLLEVAPNIVADVLLAGALWLGKKS
jgi:hypothetical protein